MFCVVLLARGIGKCIAKDVASAAFHFGKAKEMVLERKVSHLGVVALVK